MILCDIRSYFCIHFCVTEKPQYFIHTNFCLPVGNLRVKYRSGPGLNSNLISNVLCSPLAPITVIVKNMI